MEKFDVAVLGAGTASLTAAEIAQSSGKRVVLIEQARIGGECTWDGCVPSKALIRAARLRHDIARAADFGLRVDGVQVDFPAVMASVREAIGAIARYEDVAHMEARGISVRSGSARLSAGKTIIVNGERIQADRIILCTGSRPSIPSIPGLSDVQYLTNQNLFALERFPNRLLVLGAGAIGLEMGQAFQRLGSQVAIIDMEKHLLPREDADIAVCLRDVLEREGIRFLLGAQVQRVSSLNDRIVMETVVDGRHMTVEGDMLLVATGRRPNTENLDLPAVAIEVEKRGIVVNEKMETTAEGIYAAGDVTGLYPFTHVAAYQARVAAGNAIGTRGTADYRVVPWVIFTDPEIAHVGLTEEEARGQHGDNIHIVTLPFTAIDRAVIERQTQGLIKVIGERSL
jgi:pyruvate/2-oxoglutarate dehydrogenase complex dihydrolipoamide dehydrogenase (E3) component